MSEANDNNYQNRGKKKQKVQNLKKLRRSVQNITVTYDLTNKQREKLQEWDLKKEDMSTVSVVHHGNHVPPLRKLGRKQPSQ